MIICPKIPCKTYHWSPLLALKNFIEQVIILSFAEIDRELKLIVLIQG